MIQLDNAVDKFLGIILRELYSQQILCWVAGGSVRDYFMGTPLNTDIDLFFPDQQEYDKASAYFKEKQCEVKWESDNGMKIVYQKHTYDLIKKFFLTPVDTINAFDFTVSMFAVDASRVYYYESSFIDLAKRQLMINKITYPASTMRRVLSYHKKGFRICNVELRKIIEAIQTMPKDSDPVPADDLTEVSMNARFFFGID